MNIEHPDITSALATGYPRGILDRELPRCNRCRGIFMEDETAYLIDGAAFCRACVRKEITENTPFDTFLATFGVESCPADELEV